MRPIVRGPHPQNDNGEDIQFSKYQDALPKLTSRLGQYCSYCERYIFSSLAVEHIRPKKPKGSKTTIHERDLDWNNFLLACANCNSTKSNIDVIVDDYLWPDRDNPFYALEYSEGGRVKPSPHVPEDLRIKAQRIITLVGLDKDPSICPNPSDTRWRNRCTAWDLATRWHNKKSSGLDRKLLTDTVKETGHWSIWMTVFKDDPEMLKCLIEAFPGTCIECFDEESGYIALPRPECAS